jgi:hypothetical protein
MKTIYKYPLRGVLSDVEMPIGAKILHVHGQNGNPCIWAHVNSEAKTESRSFMVIGTGTYDDPGERAIYLGTVHIDWFVGHVFEVTK